MKTNKNDKDIKTEIRQLIAEMKLPSFKKLSKYSQRQMQQKLEQLTNEFHANQ